MKGAATRVQRSVWSSTPQTVWAFDLCDDLLFSNTTRNGLGAHKEDIFAFLQYSVRVLHAATELGASAISNVDGCVVAARARPLSVTQFSPSVVRR